MSWTLALTLAVASQTAPAPAAPAAPAKQRVLVLDLRNDGAKPEHARLVTDNIVVALSRFAQLEVVSSEDVRRMVETEGEKQALGCTDDSCLTEVASAMGASIVVHGSIGKLESLTIVNLSLYDSKAGKSIGRESLRVQRLDDLPYMVEDATARLVRPLLGSSPQQSGTGGSTSSSGSAPPSAPNPDAPHVNRVLAAGVGGGAACCLGGTLFFVSAAFLPVCGACVVGPLLATGTAVGAPLLGGWIGGARMSSLIVPAVVGGAAAVLTSLVAGGLVIAFPTTDANGNVAQLPYVRGAAVGAVAVALVTGGAIALATGIAADDPEPEPAPDAAKSARALENGGVSRYAMAY